MPANLQALLVALTVSVADELRSEIKLAVREAVDQALGSLSIRAPATADEVKPEILAVTTAGAARMLDVPKRKIFELMRAGSLQSFRAGKRSWRITTASIQAYVATQTELRQVSAEASERAKRLRARRGVKSPKIAVVPVVGAEIGDRSRPPRPPSSRSPSQELEG
jgi:excisionase family DNA binding protein